jgi:hypothetical protein
MLNADDWIAIGTGALAVGTFALAGVAARTSSAARRHDDEKRAEDRAADAEADEGRGQIVHDGVSEDRNRVNLLVHRQ